MSQADIEHAIEHLRAAGRRLAYGVALAVVAALVVGLGNVAYTNRVDEHRRAEAAQQDRARAAAAEQNRQLVCDLARAQASAWQDATSEPGRKSLAAWRALATRFNCN